MNILKDYETEKADKNALRESILSSALQEFSLHGFQGARMDVIARQAGCAKRMLFYYFENKEGLYAEVLDASYAAIRQSETSSDLDALTPEDALFRLAEANFDFHNNNINFSRLVLLENLQGGERSAQMRRKKVFKHSAFSPLSTVVQRGVEEGLFRKDIDVVELHYLISALCVFRVDHANTWKSILNVDLLRAKASRQHKKLLRQVIMDYVRIAKNT